jgi:pyruvate dehydrogenase E2 component (dihydrolipoamide acetyltransferase)
LNDPAEIRKLINKRRSFITVFSTGNVNPTAHCNVEAEMSAATAYRKSFNERHPAAKLTFNDMIIKAAANALRRHPLYTCAYDGGYGLIPADRIDIRFPVDIGDHLGWGLVRNADRKSLREIAAESKASIEKTRRETPRKAERWDFVFSEVPGAGFALDGVMDGLKIAGRLFPGVERWRRETGRRWRGTFLITNVGTAGIMRMEGPIVAPDILHLMITSARQTPVLEPDGKMMIRRMMPLVAKFNCAITNAVEAARFLNDVKRNLESPKSGLGPY